MPEQFGLPGFDLDAQACDRLLFAVRPSPEAAERIARFTRDKLGFGGKSVRSDLLHVTMNHLGDYHGLPPGMVARSLEAGTALAAPSFFVAFDQLMNFNRAGVRPMWVLTAGEGGEGFALLKQALVAAMARAGLGRHVDRSFTPHMTLSYSGPDGDEQTVDPIGWTVSELVLIHSLIGQSKHVVLGRWPLRGQAAIR